MDRTGLTAAVFLSLFLILLPLVSRAEPAESVSMPREEVMRAGERIYRDGMLPSGEEMQAVIRGDVFVPGSSFSCVSCHLRSGIGSIEGQILTPPTTGLKLYKPYYQYNPVIPDPTQPRKSMMDNPLPPPLFRPAYTDTTLARVISDGFNPAGRELDPVMPRYLLANQDMAILIAYLKELSAAHSPGVSKEEIRFATVIAGDVPAKESAEMLSILDALIKEHNRKAKRKNRYVNYGTHTKAAAFNYPDFVLSKWELTGSPSTWRTQLEEHYRRDPVFALLGGLSATDWQPIHTFSEENKIPCLLPLTDLPVISDTDWYTLYLSKGAYLEGEVAAFYLGRNSEFPAESKVLQVVEDSPRARAVAAGFQDAWKEQGLSAPLTLELAPGEQISVARVRSILSAEKPDAVMLWTSAGTAAALAAFDGKVKQPRRIHLSATLLHSFFKEIPEQVRPFTYISYPYRLGEGGDLFHLNSRVWLQKRSVPLSSSRISTRLLSLGKVLLEPFQVVKRDFNPAGRGNGQVIMEEQSEMMLHVRRNYYRDYLLDVIGMMADSNSLDYERLSFGPGQRYLSKGCYIVQLSKGAKPELIKMSDWVIY